MFVLDSNLDDLSPRREMIDGKHGEVKEERECECESERGEQQRKRTAGAQGGVQGGDLISTHDHTTGSEWYCSVTSRSSSAANGGPAEDGLKQLLRTGPNDSAPFHPVLRSSCRPDLEGRTNNAVR